jgi:hypothetical protein
MSPEEKAEFERAADEIAQAMVDGLRKFAAEEAARQAAQSQQTPPITSPK